MATACWTVTEKTRQQLRKDGQRRREDEVKFIVGSQTSLTAAEATELIASVGSILLSLQDIFFCILSNKMHSEFTPLHSTKANNCVKATTAKPSWFGKWILGLSILLFSTIAYVLASRHLRSPQQRDDNSVEVEEEEDWLPDVGNYSMPITVEGPSASVVTVQRLFDLGLMECFGFALTEAQQVAMKMIEESSSPSSSEGNNCPMCYWLLAMSYSPFINHPIISNQSNFQAAGSAADNAVAAASSLGTKLTRKEQGLIDAMAVRFQSYENQAIGFQAYRDKLAELHKDIPNDVDVMAFLADSVMILHSDSEGYHFDLLNPDIVGATNLLEGCLILSEYKHPLCGHLYIHITEPSPLPDRAENAADKLSTNLFHTQAQHLQHMPSHTYLRVGRYHDATLSNIKAHTSDEAYLEHNHLPYGPAHDTAFLIHAAQTSGERDVAYYYADVLRTHYTNYPDQPDYPNAELGWHIWRTVRLRFGDWEEVLQDSDAAAPRQWPYAVVLGQYTEGVASLGSTHNIHAATKRLQALQAFLPTVNESFEDVAAIANITLTSAIEYWKGNMDLALELMQAARKEQDSWAYTEPPAWFMTVAQCEGTLLRIMGKPNEAVQVFRQDLINIPENRHSLYGLWTAMIDSGADEESISNVKKHFDVASKWADNDSDRAAPIVCPLLGE